MEPCSVLLWDMGHQNSPTATMQDTNGVTESSPHCHVPLPSKGRDSNTSGKGRWFSEEGEALGNKGIFGNEGINLSLGSLQLHPSPAPALCDLGASLSLPGAGDTHTHLTDRVRMDLPQTP